MRHVGAGVGADAMPLDTVTLASLKNMGWGREVIYQECHVVGFGGGGGNQR